MENKQKNSTLFNANSASPALKELLKYLHLIKLPSTLWAIHIDSALHYITIVHIKVDKITRIVADKALQIVCNSSNDAVDIYLVIENDIVKSLHKEYMSPEVVTDISELLLTLHNLCFCKNANSTAYCKTYTSACKEFCENCISERCNSIEEAETSCLDISNNQESVNENVFHNDANCKPVKITKDMPTRSSEKIYECETCRKRFVSTTNLRIHELTHTGEKPYLCKICGKAYTTPSNLDTHKKSVHLDKKPYTCTLCLKAFVHPRLLKIHMRCHTGEKPYQCNICERSFRKNIHLTVHTRIHTGERPHLCALCGKGFTTTGNLASHKKTRHKDQRT